MQLGMVGMGRMGANTSSRLVRAGHEVVLFDRHPEKVRPLVEAGAIGTGSLGELARALEPPRAIWLMVQAASVDATIEALLPNLAPGDVLIDGGSSRYREDIRRAKSLANAGIRYVDVGMEKRDADAETAPRSDPELYRYDLDVAAIAEVWRRGSVIASWLLDLTAAALVRNPDLSHFAGRVSDSGEGRWTLEAAIDESVTAPILSTALGERFASRGEADFADRIISAMRFELGGHVERRS